MSLQSFQKKGQEQGNLPSWGNLPIYDGTISKFSIYSSQSEICDCYETALWVYFYLVVLLILIGHGTNKYGLVLYSVLGMHDENRDVVRIHHAFESTMQTISQIFLFVKYITTWSILSPKYGPLVPDLSQDGVSNHRTHLLFLHPGENGLAVCAGDGMLVRFLLPRD